MKRIRQIEQNGGPLRKNRSNRSTNEDISALYKKTPNHNSTELLPLNGKICTNARGEIRDTTSAILKYNVKENVCIPKEDEDDTIENAGIDIEDTKFSGRISRGNLSAGRINPKLIDVEALGDRRTRCQRVSKTKVSRKSVCTEV